jgi:sugar O-acyltransferase (sialic acid O-acetyltransferase NeuD family)
MINSRGGLMNSNLIKPYIVMGAGGHGIVVVDILRRRGFNVLGFLDDGVAASTKVFHTTVLGKIEKCLDYPDAKFIIAIGDNNIRRRIAKTYSLEYGSAIHPSAIIGRDVSVGLGTVIMAGAIINAQTIIGEHSIINTKASVDHDNQVGDFVHIAPGVTLGGFVKTGSNTHLGIGASVRNNVSICEHAFIGAGAVVVNDITKAGLYTGLPAKFIKPISSSDSSDK